MTPYTPRPYQSAAESAILDEFTRVNSTLLVLPTGCGKTEVFVKLAGDLPAGRTMMIAPTAELVHQTAQKVFKRTGEMPSIEMASSYANEAPWCRSRIVVASKDSLHERRLRCPGRFDDISLVVVDEAHHASKANRSYTAPLEYLREKNPAVKLLGVTATPNRADRVALGLTFDSCAYQYSIAEAVDDGWLVPPRANCIRIESMDFSGVATGSSGDFHSEQLARVLEQEETLLEIADVAYREGADRLKTLVFAHSVNEAEALSNILADRYGVACGWVCGDQRRCPREAREDTLRRFRHGALTCLVNCAVLTEGFDDPGVQHLVMARPTKSTARYAQMFGRGTRPLAGLVDVPGWDAVARKSAISASAKPWIKITDLVDNSLRHKIVSVADVLGGNMDPRVVDRARASVAKSGGGEGADVAAELAVAQALVLQEDEQDRLEQERQRKLREDRERLERERRRHIRGVAQYEAVAVNPVDRFNRAPPGGASPRGPRMTWGKYRGKLLSDVPTGYLQWVVSQAGAKKNWLSDAVAREISARRSETRRKPESVSAGTVGSSGVPAMCTKKQAGVLARYGRPTDVSYAEALRLIDQINSELRGAARQPQPVP